MKFGAHMPSAGGAWRALERGVATGCDVVQLFVKNNMQWFGRMPEPADVARYNEASGKSGFACVFGHTGYLINLGAPDGDNREKSLRSLVQEIEIATALKLPFLVLHPGAHLGAGDAAGLKNIVRGLDEAFRATPGSPVRIALENTAGQGSCLGHRFEHLEEIYDHVAAPGRLAVCIDTAHLFEAGFDIRQRKVWDAVLAEVDQRLGLKQVLAFHLNDSKTDCGSRVDRHAGIGAGHIGREAFRHIVNDPRLRGLPGCLETPKSPDLHEDLENLAILRGLVRGKSKVGRST